MTRPIDPAGSDGRTRSKPDSGPGAEPSGDTATVAPRPARRRQPPEIRRQMIIAAARDVIAERGLHATTIRDIAGAAKVAVGTVTYHFSGSAEVLAEVLQAEMTEFSGPVMVTAAAAPTGRRGLETLADGLLAAGEPAMQHWRLWLDFWTLAAHQPHYSVWQSQVYRDLHALAESLLERGRVDGSLSVTDPQRQAVEFIAMMDGLVVQGYLPGSRLNPDRARGMLRGYISASFAPPVQPPV